MVYGNSLRPPSPPLPSASLCSPLPSTSLSPFSPPLHLPLPSPPLPPIGQVVFESFGSSGTGPLHGLKVVTPYVTKDQLHQKRYKAQLNETTYVYDFPELFKKVGELARVCAAV